MVRIGGGTYEVNPPYRRPAFNGIVMPQAICQVRRLEACLRGQGGDQRARREEYKEAVQRCGGPEAVDRLKKDGPGRGGC